MKKIIKTKVESGKTKSGEVLSIVRLASSPGLTADVAKQVASEAIRYRATVVLTHKAVSANAISSVGLLRLQALKGDSVTVYASGEDAEAAIEAVKDILLAG